MPVTPGCSVSHAAAAALCSYPGWIPLLWSHLGLSACLVPFEMQLWGCWAEASWSIGSRKPRWGPTSASASARFLQVKFAGSAVGLHQEILLLSYLPVWFFTSLVTVSPCSFYFIFFLITGKRDSLCFLDKSCGCAFNSLRFLAISVAVLFPHHDFYAFTVDLYVLSNNKKVKKSLLLGI